MGPKEKAVRPKPLQDVLAFLFMLSVVTITFWLLLVDGFTIAAIGRQADPVQRTA